MPDRLSALEKLFDADPHDADTAYMIALEHAKPGDLNAALRWLDRSLAIDPEHHYAYYQKARLLNEAGQISEARDALDAGIARASGAGATKAEGELRALRDEIAGGG